MSLSEAFAPIEAINTAIVLKNTWGHLYPQIGRKYEGYILVAHGCYGDTIVVDQSFTDLPDSPWFADDLFEFMRNQNFDTIGIFRFNGWYKKFKNGNYQFGGGKFFKEYHKCNL